MAKKSKVKTSTVVSIRHKDRRANIPTKELRDFVAEDENKPKIVGFPGLLYARDSSLDPQLVWKGKDEQDRKELTVPAVPIYIQEKIQPQAIIEDLRRVAAHEAPGQQQLFADFNGIKFEDLIEFYRHDQNWTNRMILGDSLLVMTSLAEKEALKKKVQTIYFDPPYGIEFKSNWQVSTRKRDLRDSSAADVVRQPEQIKAFRDTWELGIHSYLSYLRDRLVVARDLMTESGSIFVQIGDENCHLVRCVLDEVFGSENSISQIYFRKKTMPLGGAFLEGMGDYILWYAKDKKHAKYRQLYLRQDVSEDFHWNWYELPDGTRKRITKSEIQNGAILPGDARVGRLVSMWPPSFSENAVFAVKFRGKEWWPAEGQCWPTNSEGMQRLIAANRIEIEGNYLRFFMRSDGIDLAKLKTHWDDSIGARDQKYVVETSSKVIERCLLMTTDPGDLILDPTCGSGTTACVGEQWGRRWITIDTSRVAVALARTRLMSGKFPYYLLADSPEGQIKESELAGKVPLPDIKTECDIRKGFVYTRVPQVALKSIANNSEIKDGLSNDEVNAAIARHAEQVMLYDQPYEDSKRIRVTGPFTVESLSPHRVISTDNERPTSETAATTGPGVGEYEAMVIENLKTAGVQNTVRNQRLKFDHLESHAGTWIHAAAEYLESGKTKRVAVCIGPEHGTVGPELVKEAAKEAVQGIGFDLLVVCGLAFDPHVAEEAKRYGRLSVLMARMNPDLTMGDELLKKTGAGNLFMVFGEPDIDLKKTKDNQWIAEIKGVDVYDPTTGQVRSHTTDDIACWFIDTNYNGESFFVRHAYFCGADEPYEKLKKALRAEIDESAWASLNSTKSRPFDKPKTGKIAIKVINHYGDEVLKVYEVK